MKFVECAGFDVYRYKSDGSIHGSETFILDGSSKSNNSGKAWQILDNKVENYNVEVTVKHNGLGIEKNQDIEAGIGMRKPDEHWRDTRVR